MGTCNSTESTISTKSTPQTNSGKSAKPANSKPPKDVTVPSDISEKLVEAIDNHSAETPAFDVIRASFPSDAVYCIDSVLTKNDPVLTLACKKQHIDLVEFLLNEMKADPNASVKGTDFSKTALSEIIKGDSSEKSLAGVKVMVRAGADPLAECWGGYNAYTKAIETFKTAPMARDILMALATKDGLITDMSTITVPRSEIESCNWYSTSTSESVSMCGGNPLLFAVAKENSIGALVMLELGVDPLEKAKSKPNAILDIMKQFVKRGEECWDKTLYSTIEAILEDPTKAKKATEIYDGMVAADATAAAAAPPSRDVEVPKEAADEIVAAVKSHTADTPAIDVIRKHYTPTSKYTLESKLTGDASLLTLVCKNNHVDLIEFLLNEMKADANPPKYGRFGEPALLNAIDSEKPEECLPAIKLLARAGANPMDEGYGGNNAYTKLITTLKNSQTLRDAIMALATKDGLITDLSTITVPTSSFRHNYGSDNTTENVCLREANPLHIAVGTESTVGALVMLELGVDPLAKCACAPQTLLDIMKKFVKNGEARWNRALYKTIQAVIEDPSKAKNATEVYEGILASLGDASEDPEYVVPAPPAPSDAESD